MPLPDEKNHLHEVDCECMYVGGWMDGGCLGECVCVRSRCKVEVGVKVCVHSCLLFLGFIEP